jgi:hypothetical protein
MREGMCTAVANGILRYKFLKTQRVSSKSNVGKPDSAARLCRGWRSRHLFAALPKGKSLKTRAVAFGRRAAIPDAWLLSLYQLRISLKCSRCLRRGSLPNAQRKAHHPPKDRLTVVLYSWGCWLDWSEVQSRSRATAKQVRQTSPLLRVRARQMTGRKRVLPRVSQYQSRNARQQAS